MGDKVPEIERLRRELALLDMKRFELASQVQQPQTQCTILSPWATFCQQGTFCLGVKQKKFAFLS